MSIAKFMTACDQCGEPSDQNRAWPKCWICGDDVCPDCAEGDFYKEETNKILCKKCYAAELATNEPEAA